MDSNLTKLKEIDEVEVASSVNCDIENLSQYIKIKKNDLTFITQNITSVYKNINDLQATLAHLKFENDILILTECRLDCNKPIPQIKNYTSYATTQNMNQNDGVVIFVKNNIKAKVKEIKMNHASCLQLEIFNYTILGIYRSPSNKNSEIFIESLRMHLERIKNHKNIIITGDININIISRTDDSGYEKTNRHNYLNMLAAYGLLPGHSLPTRLKNCLDHVILKLNNHKTNTNIAVLNTTITDHQMVFTCISKIKEINKAAKSKTSVNFDKALDSLANKNISNLLFCDDPNTLVELLIQKITESLQENTTTQSLTKSNRTIKPWITPGILRCIRNRNKMQKRAKIDPFNLTLTITYKRYRNFCNNLIKKIKRKYDRSQLTGSMKNAKLLWKNIKNITNIKQNKSTNTELLNIAQCPKQSVNLVNEYFGNIGRDLAENILSKNPTINTDNPPLFEANLTSFVLSDTDPAEVEKIIMSLKSDSAPGYDNIPTRFLKLCKDYIVPALSHLINLCFSKGIFPTTLKKSIITPVFKSGDVDDVNNFRPISVLTVISKVLEKIINNRVIGFLDKYNILSNAQYGFRHGISTHDAIKDLSSLIIEQLDEGKKCLTVFLDLKKAFDTVSIPILLQKLERIGIRNTPLELLKDYLTNRIQKTKIEGHISEDHLVTYGVPQGSVLGPTLFLIYINDLCNYRIDRGNIFSYADDTAIVFSEKSWEAVHNVAEAGLSKIYNWLNHNLLTLNTLKTNYICFAINNRSQPMLSTIKIHSCKSPHNECTCPLIEKVTHTKYLGVIIDQRLSWHRHLELTTCRIRKLIFTFKNLRHVAPRDLINQIYISLGQSILNYCIYIWGGASKVKFLELERAQRSLLKVMYFKPYRFPTQELYNNSKLLSVRKLYLLNLILTKHKSMPYIPINKRRKDIVDSYSVRTSFAQHQYKKQSVFIYNKVNKLLKIYPLLLIQCKKKVTEWLLTLNYDEVEDLFKVIV